MVSIFKELIDIATAKTFKQGVGIVRAKVRAKVCEDKKSQKQKN